MSLALTILTGVLALLVLLLVIGLSTYVIALLGRPRGGGYR